MSILAAMLAAKGISSGQFPRPKMNMASFRS